MDISVFDIDVHVEFDEVDFHPSSTVGLPSALAGAFDDDVGRTDDATDTDETDGDDEGAGALAVLTVVVVAAVALLAVRRLLDDDLDELESLDGLDGGVDVDVDDAA